MLVISFQYMLSVLAYCTSDCMEKSDQRLIRNSMMNSLVGFLIGISCSVLMTILLINFKYDQFVLHLINLIILTKHSYHCIKNRYKTRRMNGMFGNQKLGRGNRWIGLVLSIMDSIAFRVIEFCVFCALPLFH
jgi:hypothetical protein